MQSRCQPNQVPAQMEALISPDLPRLSSFDRTVPATCCKACAETVLSPSTGLRLIRKPKRHHKHPIPILSVRRGAIPELPPPCAHGANATPDDSAEQSPDYG